MRTLHPQHTFALSLAREACVRHSLDHTSISTQLLPALILPLPPTLAWPQQCLDDCIWALQVSVGQWLYPWLCTTQALHCTSSSSAPFLPLDLSGFAAQQASVVSVISDTASSPHHQCSMFECRMMCQCAVPKAKTLPSRLPLLR